MRLLLDRQVAAILAMVGVDLEGHRCHGAAVAQGRRHPLRLVESGQHLAVPQDGELALHLVRRQAIGDTLAGPAALERQHQPRKLRRAAAERRPEAEGAMPALHQAGRGLGEFERRVPHQRAVGEHPGLVAGRIACHRLAQARRALLGAQEEVVSGLAGVLDDLLDPLGRQLFTLQQRSTPLSCRRRWTWSRPRRPAFPDPRSRWSSRWSGARRHPSSPRRPAAWRGPAPASRPAPGW